MKPCNPWEWAVYKYLIVLYSVLMYKKQTKKTLLWKRETIKKDEDKIKLVSLWLNSHNLNMKYCYFLKILLFNSLSSRITLLELHWLMKLSEISVENQWFIWKHLTPLRSPAHTSQTAWWQSISIPVKIIRTRTETLTGI